MLNCSRNWFCRLRHSVDSVNTKTRELSVIRKWTTEYIFSPVFFFDQIKKKKLHLSVIAGGFLSCVVLYTAGHLMLVAKNIAVFNCALENAGILEGINPSSAYAISIFASINYWLIWILGILHFICIDIVVRDSKNYTLFVKISFLSFYSMVPYLIILFIYSLFYTPEKLPIPLDPSYENLKSWAMESANQLKNTKQYHLLGNFEYFFNLWLLSMICASYKSFSERSYRFSCICGIIFAAIILSISHAL